MGDWRHFGERLELVAAPHDCGAMAEIVQARAQPFPNLQSLPPDTFSIHGNLGRIIEGEILPRLMLEHRRAPLLKLPLRRHPTSDEIARFSALLLDPASQDATGPVMALLDEGISLETLLLELVTPTARLLGKMWEDDEIDFVDVTIAIGRLQAIARDLCNRLEGDGEPKTGNSILLMPCPGETHTFCLSVVASFFREACWDVTTAGPDPGCDLVRLVREEWFDVIGLTLSCDVLLPSLAKAVQSLRAASCNPRVRVLVGGPYFERHSDRPLGIDADAIAKDARAAPELAASLLEKRARAC